METVVNGQVEIQNGEIDDMEMTGDVDPISSLDEPGKPIRLIRKAKRINRTNSGGDATTSNGNGTDKALPALKNSRKSRDARGRGEPKKEPLVTPEEFDKIVSPIILEYFNHSITKEVETSLDEINISKMKSRVVELAISLAMDRKASQRELISILISDLYGKIISPKDISTGFDNLLKGLADLMLGMFMARAVADDCLPPKYIMSYKGEVDNTAKQAALEKAELLLSQKHGIVRLDNIWGIGGGIRPMVLLLKEYLSSSDIIEATRCLQELEVPHFHHELVYEATVMVLEDGTERPAERMSKFLQSLYEHCILTPEQVAQGFKRVFDNMPDINLDVPNAYTLLERFGDLCHRDGFIDEATYRELPRGGRKRFVSEGDGGKIKPAVLHVVVFTINHAAVFTIVTVVTISHAAVFTIDHGAVFTIKHAAVFTIDHGAVFTINHGAVFNTNHAAVFTINHISVFTINHAPVFTINHAALFTINHIAVFTINHAALFTINHAAVFTINQSAVFTTNHAAVFTINHAAVFTINHIAVFTINHAAVFTIKHASFSPSTMLQFSPSTML
ncbi:PDCD4-like protein [Mya arenaria]|uniref:PDCD4-like protein n=1 Tax=Mya arenaria TaxID=6604 RepID=A0ABY7FKR1_MYAAR|nr:PDCD4-like protein [Mya arenaria]